MTAPPRLARVRKARRSSVLSCGHFVLTGQLIVKRGQGWRCLPCALEDIGASREAPSGPGWDPDGHGDGQAHD